MTIYQQMERDWDTYCLMASIIYIEEISKPTRHLQIKKYKNKEYRYSSFHSIRLKMKDEEVIQKIFEITKIWEKRKGIPLIGFSEVKEEKFDKQKSFYLTPLWLNYILAECGRIPNKYSFKTASDRINNIKRYKKIFVKKDRNKFNLLLKNKKLAAGAFIVSMDLEFRGIQSGRPSLCMSERYKDFLEFMLKVARKWNWTNNKNLSKVNVNYSKKLGINASPQYEFRINVKGLREIYELAGPLVNTNKDKCIKFHIQRSKNYINLGSNLRKNKTRDKILAELNKNQNLTTTELQFIAGVGVDVVLDHLHKLEKDDYIQKERRGKRYIWRSINAH